MRPRALAFGLVRIPLRRVAVGSARGAVTIELVHVVSTEELGTTLEVVSSQIVAPSRDDERAFGLLREALRRAGCVGIGRVNAIEDDGHGFSNRFAGLSADRNGDRNGDGNGRRSGRAVVLQPLGPYLLAQEIRDADELRALANADAPRLDADPVEVEMWDELVARLRTPASPLVCAVQSRAREGDPIAPRRPLVKTNVASIEAAPLRAGRGKGT